MVSILCKHDKNQKVEIFIDDILRCSVSYNGVTCLKNIDLSPGTHKVYIRQVSAINKWYWLFTCLNPKDWQWLFNIGLNFNWYEEGRYVGYDWNYAQISFELDIENNDQDLEINLMLYKKFINIDNKFKKHYYNFEISLITNNIKLVNLDFKADKKYMYRWKIKQLILPIVIILYLFIEYLRKYGTTCVLSTFESLSLIFIAFYFIFGFYKIIKTKSTYEELEKLR